MFELPMLYGTALSCAASNVVDIYVGKLVLFMFLVEEAARVAAVVIVCLPFVY